MFFFAPRDYILLTFFAQRNVMSSEMVFVGAPPDGESNKRKKTENENKAFFTFTIPSSEIRRLCTKKDLGDSVTVEVTRDGVKCKTDAECRNLWDALDEPIQDHIKVNAERLFKEQHFKTVQKWAYNMGKLETPSGEVLGGWSQKSVDAVKEKLPENSQYTEAVDNLQQLFKIMFDDGRSGSSSGSSERSDAIEDVSYPSLKKQGMVRFDDQGMVTAEAHPLYQFETETGINWTETGIRADDEERVGYLTKFIAHFSLAVSFLFDKQYEQLHVTTEKGKERRMQYADYDFIKIYIFWMVQQASEQRFPNTIYQICAQDALLWFVLKNTAYPLNKDFLRADSNYTGQGSVRRIRNTYTRSWGEFNDDMTQVARLYTILKLVNEDEKFDAEEDDEDDEGEILPSDVFYVCYNVTRQAKGTSLRKMLHFESKNGGSFAKSLKNEESCFNRSEKRSFKDLLGNSTAVTPSNRYSFWDGPDFDGKFETMDFYVENIRTMP
jgi:hypothetical protein